MILKDVCVRIIEKEERSRFDELLSQHHYLGKAQGFGNTLRYCAEWEGEWVALLTFSASAWKCSVRDQWIGWNYRNQFSRLHLVANNTRFLILPSYHEKNLASKVLSLCIKRIQQDWLEHFSYPILMLETFVDPSRFDGTLYRASNFQYLGKSKGFQKSKNFYSHHKTTPKFFFIRPLQKNARAILSHPFLPEKYHRKGVFKMNLEANIMKSLPYFLRTVEDPRRTHGIRHSIVTILSISVAAVLCGAKGYKAIANWAKELSQKSRENFECRKERGKFVVPSEYVIRDVLIRVDPEDLDKALQGWNEAYSPQDPSLAIDGKTMKNALDSQGKQTHIIGVVGHENKVCYAQKKSLACQLKMEKA